MRRATQLLCISSALKRWAVRLPHMVIRLGQAPRTQRHLQHQTSDLMYTKYIDFMQPLKHCSKTQGSAMGHITFAGCSILYAWLKGDMYEVFRCINIMFSYLETKASELSVVRSKWSRFARKLPGIAGVEVTQVIFEWHDPFRSDKGTRVGSPFICICWLLLAMEFVLLVVYGIIVQNWATFCQHTTHISIYYIEHSLWKFMTHSMHVSMFITTSYVR